MPDDSPVDAILARLERRKPGLLAEIHKVYFPPRTAENDYDGAFARVSDRLAALAQETAFLRDHAESLQAFPDLPVHRRDFFYFNSNGRIQRQLLLQLGQRAWAVRFTDHAACLAYAEAALAYRQRLDIAPLTRNERAGLDSYLEANLANALRLVDRLPESREAFTRARLALADSTNPLDHAWVDFLESLALRIAAQPEIALPLISRAVDTYQGFEDALLPDAYLAKGLTLTALGRFREAGRCYQACASESKDERIILAAAHARARSLLDAERPRDAQRYFALIRPLYNQPEFAAFRPLGIWLEGSIEAALDWLDDAETHLGQARALLLEAERLHEALLVGIELAEVHLRRGQAAQAAALARELHAYAVTEDLGPDQELARFVLRQAAEQVVAQAAALVAVRTYLTRRGLNATTRLALPASAT